MQLPCISEYLWEASKLHLEFSEIKTGSASSRLHLGQTLNMWDCRTGEVAGRPIPQIPLSTVFVIGTGSRNGTPMDAET